MGGGLTWAASFYFDQPFLARRVTQYDDAVATLRYGGWLDEAVKSGTSESQSASVKQLGFIAVHRPLEAYR